MGERGGTKWRGYWKMTGWWFQIFFIFTPTWGDDPIWLNLTNIFQMGWNHQVDDYWGESEAGHVKILGLMGCFLIRWFGNQLWKWDSKTLINRNMQKACWLFFFSIEVLLLKKESFVWGDLELPGNWQIPPNGKGLAVVKYSSWWF